MSRGLQYLDEEFEDDVRGFEKIPHKPKDISQLDRTKKRAETQVRREVLEKNHIKRGT
jgi:hypothetical protein